MSSNPLAFVSHLRGPGATLRARVEKAESLAKQIAHLQAELDALVARTKVDVSMNWTEQEMTAAMADAEAGL